MIGDFIEKGGAEAEQGSLVSKDGGDAGATLEFLVDAFEGVGGAEAALGGNFEGENGQATGEVALHPMRKFWSGCGVGGVDFRKAASRPDLNATDFFAGLGGTQLVGLA